MVLVLISLKYWYLLSWLNPFSSHFSLFQVCYFVVIQNPRYPLVDFDPFDISGCYIWSKTRLNYLDTLGCYYFIQMWIYVKKLHYYPFLAKYYSFSKISNSDVCETVLHNYPPILMTNKSLPDILWQKVCFW